VTFLRLVKSANEPQSSGVQFTTRGHRAWYAYQCLPRQPNGNAPSKRALEKAHGLYHQSLHKLFYDKVAEQSYDVMKRIAQALRCDVDWLQEGTGDAPKTSNQVYPRPELDEAKPRKRRPKTPKTAVGFR
jgi:hypothetical protein